MSNYICHHGVKGQKWGVRRFQNQDGSLTPLGRDRQHNTNKSTRDVQSIIDTLSYREKSLLDAENGSYTNADQEARLAKRFIKRVSGVPVAFLDIHYEDTYDTNFGEISVATRSEEQYRHHGYASELVDRAQKWFDKPETREYMDALVWNAYSDNEKSISLAQAKNFIKDLDRSGDTWWTGLYRRSHG